MSRWWVLMSFALQGCESTYIGPFSEKFFSDLGKVSTVEFKTVSFIDGDLTGWAKIDGSKQVRDSLVLSWNFAKLEGNRKFHAIEIPRPPKNSNVEWFECPKLSSSCQGPVLDAFPEDCKEKNWAPAISVRKGRFGPCNESFLVESGQSLYLYALLSKTILIEVEKLRFQAGIAVFDGIFA